MLLVNKDRPKDSWASVGPPVTNCLAKFWDPVMPCSIKTLECFLVQDGVLKLFAKASAELGRVLHQGVCVSPLFSASWRVR